MGLDQRIQLLAQSGTISKVTVNDIHHVIATLQKWQVDTNQEQVVILITHIAMALERAQQGQVVDEPLDEELLSELQQEPHFMQVEKLSQSLLHECQTQLSQAERSYLWAGLGALCDTQPHLIDKVNCVN